MNGSDTPVGAGTAGAPASRPSGPRSFRLLIGAVIWGLCMMMAVLIAVYLRNRLETGRLPSILTLYFVGGAIAWIPAQMVARLAASRARQETRFAAQFVCLTLFTIGFTALIFALDYRGFYAQWHAPTFSYIWFLQQFYTIGGATYQFAVIGLPVGLPLLIVTSLWQARDIS